MTYNIKEVYKDKNVIIIEKPVGMPTQQDPTGDKDALSATSEYLSELGERCELWLIHRLDRTVGGLIAFARNKKSAAALSIAVKDGIMEKKYFAISHGKASPGEYRDFLYKDNATSKAYVVKTERKGAKLAILNAETLAENEKFTLSEITLKTGRFHQIRAQFSSRGTTLVGDKKYGSRDLTSGSPALFACSLSFELFGRKICANSLPPLNAYPWNSFDESVYVCSSDEK